MDPRSLGLFRVALGLVLLSDLLRRFVELRFWYVNSGLLPNHTLLWRPPAGRMFSLFFTISSEPEARLAFGLCALVYAAFLVGYRTGLMQVLTLVVRVSVNTRLAVLENGGDMVMDLLCLLSLPLPLGARFSLDAVAAAQRDGSKAAVAWAQRPVVSVAMLGLILQFAIIYLMNAASKNGQAWRDGSAIHYALHQDKLVTWVGVWMREHVPEIWLRHLTRAVLSTEWLGFALIISPVFVRQARLLAVCVMPLLHLGFALGLNLGGFSVAMVAFYPLLLRAEHWEMLARSFGARVQPRVERLELAVRELLSWVRYPLVSAPSLVWRVITEGLTLLVLVAIATEVVNDNTPVPRALRVAQPDWAKAVIEYPRILQGWRMFASEPPRGDSMIFVDAKTADGRHVDPYNEVASDQRYPDGNVVPVHMGQSQFFVMYTERIANVSYAAYRQAFSEWLVAYPERTRRPQDCLVSYEVYLVTDESPAVGSNQPKPAQRQRFMSYTAPFDSPCRTLQASALSHPPPAG
ncbi:MAG TPA: hypothetical protein VHB79_33130 [Polyangiaceae bacterium]|nr:hypothetical protein [Polyangiaceae bacterium]